MAKGVNNMKLRYLNEEVDGTKCVEILCNEISFRSLLRCIRRIEGVEILKASHDPMNDNARIDFTYLGTPISIDTPFSDYLINCSKPDQRFDYFIEKLSSHKVKFWQRFM